MSEPSQLMTEDIRVLFMLHSRFLVRERNGSCCTVHGGTVVEYRKGAVFGGLVEEPLKPSTKKRYQGSNDTFVFTNTPGCPVIFRPTGTTIFLNTYFPWYMYYISQVVQNECLLCSHYELRKDLYAYSDGLINGDYIP
ncbi:putative TLDc domain-containing protein [Helianthus anomalus]